MPWFDNAGVGDGDAIHDNVAGEIDAITEKTTPVDADLLIIEDSENGYIKKGLQVGNLPTGSGNAPEWVAHLASPDDSADIVAAQEFNGSSGFTKVEPSGTTNDIEARSLLSVLFHGQTSSHATAYLWAFPGGESFAVNDYLEVGMMVTGLAGSENTMVGCLLTDGTTTTSNQMACWYFFTTLGNIDLRGGVLNNFGATLGQREVNVRSIMPLIRIRLRYTATNTWQGEISPDGLQWTAYGASTVSRTITPTHYGVTVSRSGSGAEPSVVGFEYVRWYRP